MQSRLLKGTQGPNGSGKSPRKQTKPKKNGTLKSTQNNTPLTEQHQEGGLYEENSAAAGESLPQERENNQQQGEAAQDESSTDQVMHVDANVQAGPHGKGVVNIEPPPSPSKGTQGSNGSGKSSRKQTEAKRNGKLTSTKNNTPLTEQHPEGGLHEENSAAAGESLPQERETNQQQGEVAEDENSTDQVMHIDAPVQAGPLAKVVVNIEPSPSPSFHEESTEEELLDVSLSNSAKSCNLEIRDSSLLEAEAEGTGGGPYPKGGSREDDDKDHSEALIADSLLKRIVKLLPDDTDSDSGAEGGAPRPKSAKSTPDQIEVRRFIFFSLCKSSYSRAPKYCGENTFLFTEVTILLLKKLQCQYLRPKDKPFRPRKRSGRPLEEKSKNLETYLRTSSMDSLKHIPVRVVVPQELDREGARAITDLSIEAFRAVKSVFQELRFLLQLQPDEKPHSSKQKTVRSSAF